MLAELQKDTARALDDLRDLARGIYPPLLADKGLVAALEAQARRAPVPVSVRSDGFRRYPQDVETAVYFSVLEALQNVAKYAEATSVEVSLDEQPGAVRFAVHDDGRGFDPGGIGYGTGLQGIADRLGAVEGRLEIESEPGRGTTVAGTIPVDSVRAGEEADEVLMPAADAVGALRVEERADEQEDRPRWVVRLAWVTFGVIIAGFLAGVWLSMQNGGPIPIWKPARSRA